MHLAEVDTAPEAPPDPCVQTLIWTEFTDEYSVTKKQHAGTWAGLVQRIHDAKGYSNKKACPWVKLARFGETRTEGDALRSNDNVIEVTGIEGDYDGEQMTPDEALRKLEAAQMRACIYTSPSHSPQKPRWRVLAPLSKAMPPGSRRALVARLNGVLGGILAGESFTLSQSYYYGATVGAPEYRVLPTFDDPDEGHCINELDELDELAIGKPAKAADGDGLTVPDKPYQTQRLHTIHTGGPGLHAALRGEAASLIADGLRPDAVTKQLRAMMDASAGEHDARWSERRAEISRLVRSAQDKFGADASIRREQQRRQTQAIGDGTADAPPLADLMTLEEMREQLVFVSDGARVARRDRPHIALALQEFRLHSRASETRVGKKMVPTAEQWVQDADRVSTHTLTFRPGHDEFTFDPEGAPALNLWRPRMREAVYRRRAAVPGSRRLPGAGA